MNLKAAMAGIIVCAGLSSCKTIKIENGQIPVEYLPLAEKFVGDYEGRFDGFQGTLTLTLQGDKMSASYANKFGTDLIDPRCQSTIGDLVEIEASGSDSDPKIDGASFEFFSNFCNDRIEGRYLSLGLKEKDGMIDISARILERWERRVRCRTEVDGRGRRREICESTQEPVYLWGEFSRRVN